MSRRVDELTLESLRDIPLRCRACVFWELSPLERAIAVEADPEFEKEVWTSSICLHYGTAGKVAKIDGRVVGFAMAGPPEEFPRSESFPARVSKDAWFLATAYVLPEAVGRGLGKALVQAVLRDAKEHGKRALECFADRSWAGPDCMLPAGFCERIGFKVRREHVRFPLMRIDVRSLAKLTESAAEALEDFLRHVAYPAPAPGAARSVPR
ncbi:MAG: GNAT family N-acetyltransferase [Actinobacteria bacterium]|nr:MAG: GNAT family N-acetyltransferase [Actinomycetota bacterium]